MIAPSQGWSLTWRCIEYKASTSGAINALLSSVLRPIDALCYVT